MSFGEAIKSVFSKYATFSGRARRSEYWYFWLFIMLVNLALGCIPLLGVLSFVWTLAIIIPSIAVTVRRFHDIGNSGWYYLFIFIPELLFFGNLLYVFFLIIKESINAGIDLADLSNIHENAAILTECTKAYSSSFSNLAIVGVIFLAAEILWLIWMTRDSQPGENKWGPNPKEVPSENNSGMNY